MLRPYQQQAIEGIFQAWESHRSTLIVLPTGTGKTVTFSEVVKRVHPSRTIVIAHRTELLSQAARHVSYTGLETEIEQADLMATAFDYGSSPVLVASVQTLISGRKRKRMERFDPDDFGLLVIDEAHHATASSYREIINYFSRNPNLKILGCTATPDRADKEALGQIFESVAFDYEILDAINDGWLVPVEQQLVHIDGLDFSHVRVTAGDLNGADLAAVMEAEKPLHGIASATLDIVGDRRTLVFAVSVKQAEMLSEIFNRHRPGMAAFISGKTPDDVRQQTFEKFSDGRIQILTNCAVATEGYDNPGVEVIVQARPTKSRALYSQIVGRGLRPLGNLVDGFEDAEDRRIAIAESQKPVCTVLDFAGNSGRHKLMTCADILGGKYSEEVRALAVKQLKEQGKAMPMDEALEAAHKAIQREIEEARAREAARKAHLTAQAQYSVQDVSPFDLFHLSPAKAKGWDRVKRVSHKQAAMLRSMGVDPETVTFTQASQLIGETFRRRDEHLATFKQCKLLQKHGYDAANMQFVEASKLIDSLAKNGWRRVA